MINKSLNFYKNSFCKRSFDIISKEVRAKNQLKGNIISGQIIKLTLPDFIYSKKKGNSL